jgi:hypothetical protein
MSAAADLTANSAAHASGLSTISSYERRIDLAHACRDLLCRSKDSIAQLQPPVRSSVKDTSKTPQAAVPVPAASTKGGKVRNDLNC